ncbi:MAG: ribonuclease H-like domain-containing protein [Desulfobacterales bacterium]|jgi:predicted PolB exonuclease-like 3'-5' exonuclease|nr:ribonuclease H-like domain-containing protein [Desulfobacterales bacterium]
MNAKYVCFDLETIADRSILHHLPAVQPKGNLKDPAKIKEDIAEKEKDRLAKLGLDPLTCMIAAFGWADFNGNSGHFLLKDETHEAELELVENAWELLSKYSRFVTFNGINFDVPVLMMRSMRRHVRPAVKIDTKRYYIGNHVDLRMVLNNWNNMGAGTFDTYSKILLGKGKQEGIDGSMVQDFWDVGMRDEIGQYGERDAVDTMQLYELVKQYYL